MTAMTPLERALAAWGRARDPEDRQPQIDDAIALAETGMFSVRHIILITGLPDNFAYELIDKPDKTGGRFNPQALDTLFAIWQSWSRSNTCDHQLVKQAVAQGCSPRTVARLTGIPKSTVFRWIEEGS